MREALIQFEALLAKIVCDPDPIQARSKIIQSEALPLAQRELLASIDEDGLRMTSLLVTKLRFERLLRGSAPAEEWFEADPKDFAQAFKQYHKEVPPTAFFPQEEAKLFRVWCEQEEVAEDSR
jgi:hypothetical protein